MRDLGFKALIVGSFSAVRGYFKTLGAHRAQREYLMEPIKLTAAQINYLDEMKCEELAADRTLEAAMRYHSNRKNELIKANKKFWDDLQAENPELREAINSGRRFRTEAVDLDLMVVEFFPEDR